MNFRSLAKISALVSAYLVAVFLSDGDALAHEGHEHGPGEEQQVTSGPIVVSAEAIANLQLTTVEVKVQTIEEVLTVIGQVESIPSRSVAITSRIPGRVFSLKVLEGESVKKGQTLVEVESRQLGDPPPRVEYRAPIDGVVLDRHAVLGDTVEPDKHLLKVVDLSEVYVEGRIYEGQLSQVKNGQQVRVVIESYPEESFTGVVEVISGALDPDSRTLQVWARVPNPAGKLRPNMRATVHIAVSQVDSVIAVPDSAVLGESGEFFVFVESPSAPNEFLRRPVVVGARDDQYLEIVEGVVPGDRVVTSGNYQLQYIKPKAAEAVNGTGSEHSASDDPAFENQHGRSASYQLLWIVLIISLVANLVLLALRVRRGGS